MSSSRRKQYHPNKFGARENLAPNDKRKFNENENKNKIKDDSDNDSYASSSISVGITFGPFGYCQNDQNEINSDENLVEIVDVQKKKHSYHMKDSLAYQWIQQLNISSNLEECNCMLRDDGHELKLIVLKPVASIKDFVASLEITKNMVNGHGSNPDVTSPLSSDSMPILAPEKQPILIKNFLCKMCGTRFSNPRTLEAHQTYYCNKQPTALHTENHVDTNEVSKTNTDTSSISIDCGIAEQNIADPSANRATASTSPSALLTNMANFMQSASPPVILLPCAFTDNDVMQIIGYPQTVIPVAVSRNLTIPLRPLIFEESLINGIEFSTDHVTVEQKAEHGEMFKLPLAIKTSNGQINLLSSGQLITNQRPKSVIKRTSDKGSSPFQSALPINASTSVAGTTASTSASVSVDPIARPMDSNKVIPPINADVAFRSSNVDAVIRPINVDAVVRSTNADAAVHPINTAVRPTNAIIRPINMNTVVHPMGMGATVVSQQQTHPVVTVTHISVVPNQTVLKTIKPSNPLPKAFPCPNCGVTFSNEKTLDGHLTFYCTANKNQCKDPKVTRKLIENQRLCCQFCDYTTSTSVELLEHIKLAHSSTSKSPYNCDLCGYRGHSARGINSHVKHAHPIEGVTTKTSSKNHDSSDTDAGKSHCSSDEGTPKVSNYDPSDDEPDPKRRRATMPIVTANRNYLRSNSDGQDTTSLIDNSRLKLEPTENDDDHQHRCASASSSSMMNEQSISSASSSMSTKYKCKFCSYQSPYKGNVKRHLVLVHKNDNNDETKDG